MSGRTTMTARWALLSEAVAATAAAAVVEAVMFNVSAAITSSRTVVAATVDASFPATIQHFLCFLPEPQGHFSLGFVFFVGGMMGGH